MVGVALGPDPRFDDDRAVPVEAAAEIGKSLRLATLVAAMDLDGDPGRVLRIAGTVGAGLVQSVTGAVPPAEVRAALAGAGIGLVLAGVEIAHDDDPSWVLSRYAEVPGLGTVLFQADVLGEYRDSWRFLREESPAYPEEFQIDDLNELGRDAGLVATLDFTPANVTEIVAALPGIRGIALPLAEAARAGVHAFGFGDAVAVLRALGGG